MGPEHRPSPCCLIRGAGASLGSGSHRPHVHGEVLLSRHSKCHRSRPSAGSPPLPHPDPSWPQRAAWSRPPSRGSLQPSSSPHSLDRKLGEAVQARATGQGPWALHRDRALPISPRPGPTPSLPVLGCDPPSSARANVLHGPSPGQPPESPGPSFSQRIQ